MSCELFNYLGLNFRGKLYERLSIPLCSGMVWLPFQKYQSIFGSLHGSKHCRPLEIANLNQN